MGRLVRFLWWVGISIIWAAYMLIIALPLVILLSVACIMEKFADWAAGDNWMQSLKERIEDLAPPDETNSKL